MAREFEQSRVNNVILDKEKAGFLAMFAELSSGMDVALMQGDSATVRTYRASLYVIVQRLRDINELNAGFKALYDAIGARRLDLLVHWGSISRGLETIQQERGDDNWEVDNYRSRLGQIRGEFRKFNHSK